MKFFPTALRRDRESNSRQNRVAPSSKRTLIQDALPNELPRPRLVVECSIISQIAVIYSSKERVNLNGTQFMLFHSSNKRRVTDCWKSSNWIMLYNLFGKVLRHHQLVGGSTCPGHCLLCFRQARIFNFLNKLKTIQVWAGTSAAI